MHSPVHLHTVADLLARDHTLQLYCLRCDRWCEAPLEQLARRGLADRPITALRFRCARCGTLAQRQLRPPELPPATGTGWMQLHSHDAGRDPSVERGTGGLAAVLSSVSQEPHGRHGMG